MHKRLIRVTDLKTGESHTATATLTDNGGWYGPPTERQYIGATVACILMYDKVAFGYEALSATDTVGRPRVCYFPL